MLCLAVSHKLGSMSSTVLLLLPSRYLEIRVVQRFLGRDPLGGVVSEQTVE